MKLRCKLIVGSDVEHLHQIYAGFAMLHRRGEIKLTQVIAGDALANKRAGKDWNDYRFFNTSVVVNDRITITYDTHDRAWIDPEILSKSDLYFKRSFLRSDVLQLADGDKVRPLGLNMQVNSAERDPFRLRRAGLYSARDRIKTMIKSLRLDDILANREPERLDNIEDRPRPELEPRVLFMARLWDPAKIESRQQSEAVEAMNSSRVQSILRLRRELGDRFLGGVSHDDYSKKYFPEALIDDAALTQKRSYLKTLRQFPICVATVGLNGSNGWKLAEYVAAAKAIISESLVYEVPGEFEAGRNYLEFRSADELVEAAVRLIEDASVRGEMMEANHRHFREHGRPDAMVRNSLRAASALLAG